MNCSSEKRCISKLSENPPLDYIVLYLLFRLGAEDLGVGDVVEIRESESLPTELPEPDHLQEDEMYQRRAERQYIQALARLTSFAQVRNTLLKVCSVEGSGADRMGTGSLVVKKKPTGRIVFRVILEAGIIRLCREE